MPAIYAYRDMSVGLLLPGSSTQTEDRYYLRPPVSGSPIFDGLIFNLDDLFLAPSNSQGTVLYRGDGYPPLVLDPAQITEGVLREATVSYGQGQYLVRYFYTVTTSDIGTFQNILGIRLLSGDGTPLLDVTPWFPYSGSPLFTINSATGEIFDERGQRAGQQGSMDLWTVILGSDLQLSGSIEDDFVALTASSYTELDGGPGNDTLIGGSGRDLINGGRGNDLLDGGAGRDKYNAERASTGIDVTLAGSAWVTVHENGLPTDVIRNFEDLKGGPGDDTLFGDEVANTLNGGLGSDTLHGGAGNDVLEDRNQSDTGFDLIDGGAGFDVADFWEYFIPLAVTLAGADASTVFVDGAPRDTLRNIEGFIAGFGDDTLAGDGFANFLVGGDGNDTLDGRGGNDTLHPGYGMAETLTGGTGIDTATWGAAGDEWWYTDHRSLRITLSRDTPVLVYANEEIAGSLRSVENLIGGTGNDTFTGDALNNRLEGGAGDDTLTGGGGADVLAGGSGSDSLKGGAGTDTADYSAEGSPDDAGGYYIDLSSGYAFALDGLYGLNFAGEMDDIFNIENVTGSPGTDLILGDALSNRLLGGKGDDYLLGYAGTDVLNGGAGFDTAFFIDKILGVTITLNGTNAAAVLVDGIAEDTLIGIENLVGGSADDSFTGDIRANTLVGGEGADTLLGAGGVDTLFGGGGLDTLDGGAGFDWLDYGSSSAVLGIAASVDPVVVTLTGGNVSQVQIGGVLADSVRNFEGVIGGAGADTLTGDILRNQLLGGGGADTLNGKAGADILSGGVDSGIDWFVFDTTPGPNNVDTVREFFVGVDKIVLDDDVFTRLSGTSDGSALLADNLVVGERATALDANDYLVFDTETEMLSYDADGAGAGAALAIVQIKSDLPYLLSAGDFIVIA